jgi:hypothetical protein
MEQPTLDCRGNSTLPHGNIVMRNDGIHVPAWAEQTTGKRSPGSLSMHTLPMESYPHSSRESWQRIVHHTSQGKHTLSTSSRLTNVLASEPTLEPFCALSSLRLTSMSCFCLSRCVLLCSAAGTLHEKRGGMEHTVTALLPASESHGPEELKQHEKFFMIGYIRSEARWVRGTLRERKLDM